MVVQLRGAALNYWRSGMDGLAAFAFLSEIQTQAQYAMNAVPQVNQATRALKLIDSNTPAAWPHSEEVFRGLHSFLTHASNVSQILWPGAPKRKMKETNQQYDERVKADKRMQRGEVLRKLLGIDDGEHPLKSRKLRDHLEHFDERLDEWAAAGANRTYLQDFIGDVRETLTIAPRDQMRSFDPDLVVFRFRGEEFELAPLQSALAQIKTRAAGAAFRLCSPEEGG
jgi:hypothetical protein